VQHRHADDIHPYGNPDDVDPYGLADRCTDDVDPYGLADFHALSCADVDAHSRADAHVRACLHAPHHARCGLTGLHAYACTMTFYARTRTQSWAPPSITLCCTHLRRDRAGTELGLRRCWSTSAPGLTPICACD
jgi:hypothetical protein